MRLRFARSAAKHGVSRERIQYVVEHCLCPTYPPDGTEEEVILFLGMDVHGVPLEVVGIELEGDEVLIIHAMKLRGGYMEAFEKVMQCQNS